MTAGVFSRYRRPRLLADQVRPTGDGAVKLQRGQRKLTLDVVGPRDAALADLRALQRGQWPALNDARNGSPLAVILDELDALGWIGEAEPVAQDLDQAWRTSLDALVERGRQALNGVDEGTRRAMKRRLLGGMRDPAEPLGRNAQALGVEDVLVRALRVQGERESTWQALVIARLFGAAGTRWPAQGGGWMEDARELEIAVASQVFWSLKAETAPMALPPLPTIRSAARVCALEVMRDAEQMLRDWNASVPDAPVLAAGQSARAARQIARGIHLQQYYVSLKYVESVLPVLGRSAAPGLRALIWRYLQEEMGHEDYELAACLQLGLRASQVRANVPLPAFAVFHRVMAHAATLHPVVWLTSLPLAEGLPGERKPLPAVLARAGLRDPAFAAHVEADVTLDHAWRARRIAAHLGTVDAATRRAAAQMTATTWALTRLGWEQLVHRFSAGSGAGVVTSPWDWPC
jgi:hypothetical protein